jgi:signal transduction histidine kinase
VNSMAADFAANYDMMLRRPGVEGDEVWLNDANLIGRRALNEDYSVLDIVRVHHDALMSRGEDPRRQTDAEQLHLRNASAFLGECLASFEMALRGVRASNARLVTLNAELEQVNVRLRAETVERERLEETLRQAFKLQAVGRLAGGVAHHFNNLLTVILGNLDIVQRRDLDPAARGKHLTAATGAAERAAKVTRQLLTFSGRQQLRPELFEPDALLPDLATLILGSLGAKVTIDVAFPPGLWPIMVDTAELELAVLNLCVNARDAMPNGGHLRVSAGNRTIRDERLGIDGSYLVIEVADTGSGIPPELLSKVCEPFFTTKDVGVGTGLGLSHVHGFAEQSGGAVDIESEVGLGTTIRLYLPVLAGAKVRAGEIAAYVRLATILVVEDDIEVAEIAVATLANYGYDVRTAYRAQAALDLLRRGEKIDLVFSDIVMPGEMDGVELAAEITQHYPGLPMLLTTGYSDACSDAEAQGFQIIGKPYRSQQLCSRISAMLAAARSSEAIA